MESSTKSKIFYTSFRLFLENGYEATNIRDICKEVGVKASTVYFHYKSKQGLFFYIYDQIYVDYINYIKSLKPLQSDISMKEKLFILLKKKLEYYMLDLSKRKFILRYHLFPPEEISNEIREKYKFYSSEENRIILDILGNSHLENKFINENIDSYLLEWRKLESHLVYEMIMSNVKIRYEIIEKIWNEIFQSCKTN